MKKPAIFLDRDGILNEDTGYVYKIEDFKWLKNVKKAIKLCNDSGYLVFIVSNQSGISRGYYTKEDVEILHNYIQEELNKIGAHIDEFSYCPHFQEGCDCRKPKPGQILKLIKKYNVDISKSFLIGDRESDIEAAKNANIKGILFTQTNLLNLIENLIN